MDPISILAGTLGAQFLEEGIKFLWAEAGKILDRYHKRRSGQAEDELTAPAPEGLQLPATRRIAFSVVEQRVAELERLIGDLAVYGVGARPIAAEDAAMLKRADELQSIVAEVFGLRPPARVESAIRVEKLEESGTIIGVDVEGVLQNDTRSVIDVKNAAGGITGVKAR